jgi:hypothetical protein
MITAADAQRKSRNVHTLGSPTARRNAAPTPDA